MTSKAQDKALGFTRSWLDITHVNPRRSLILMALGAVIGLVFAGYALFTAKGTSTLVVPAEDVALVNQQPISRSDFVANLQALYNVDYSHATPEQRRKVLDDMIREELYVQRGKELDVASVDSEVRTAMVNAVEQEVAADAITAQTNEAKLQAYYQAHQDRYSSEGMMTVRDLVFAPSAAAAAQQAAQALQAGASPDEAAKRFGGKDSGKVNGEEFYFAAKIHLGDALFAAAKALPNGTVSGVIPASDGLHVLVMAQNKRPVPLNFARAHDQVLNDYRNDTVKRLIGGDDAFFRKRANILIAKDMR